VGINEAREHRRFTQINFLRAGRHLQILADLCDPVAADEDVLTWQHFAGLRIKKATRVNDGDTCICILLALHAAGSRHEREKLQ
jgi:hypothetical protein